MNVHLVDEIAHAILYEGYILYPYRPSALKNRHRFSFGVVAPHGTNAAGAGHPYIESQCLVRAAASSVLEVSVRFLQLASRTTCGLSWDEGIEREVRIEAGIDDLCHDAAARTFGWLPIEAEDRSQEYLTGEVDVSAEPIGRDGRDGRLFKIRVTVTNTTPVDPEPDADRDELLRQSLVSAHIVLHAATGEFISMIEPPLDMESHIASCRNTGVWPVLIGEPGAEDAMLASPIILADHPQISSESPGEFFDGTEIDEMLVLRILTMTEAEKEEVRSTDERARRLLERTEKMSPAELMSLHGVMRDSPAPQGRRRI